MGFWGVLPLFWGSTYWTSRGSKKGSILSRITYLSLGKGDPGFGPKSDPILIKKRSLFWVARVGVCKSVHFGTPTFRGPDFDQLSDSVINTITPRRAYIR